MKFIILFLLSFNLYAASTLKTNLSVKDGKEIRVYNSANSFYTGLKSNATASVTFTLPQTDGTSGQVLKTSGTGSLSFGNLDTSTASLTDYDSVGSWGIPITATMSINRAINALSNQYASSATQTQYNLTVTGTNWTTVRAIGVPYVTSNGIWRLRFNIQGSFFPAFATPTLTLDGVVFSNSFTSGQAVSAYGAQASYYKGIAYPNVGNLSFECGVNTAGWTISGDVELQSKPTWAN